VTHNVVLSSALHARFPDVASAIVSACTSEGIMVHELVQAAGCFVEFKYEALGYGGLERPRRQTLLRVKRRWRSWRLDSLMRSDIILDNGGNCLLRGDRAIITDVVFHHNPAIAKRTLLRRLEAILEAQVIIIPREPGDEMGHADGIVRWIDNWTVFVNDYTVMPEKMWKYESDVIAAFKSFGIKSIVFPFAAHRCPQMTEKEFRKQYPDADDFNPGYGYFINYLQVGDLILLPSFGVPEDATAVSALESMFPRSRVFSIDCARLSMYGGLLNCVTAQWETP
jgi:agmatine/peptidylarginine deiminase